MSLLLNNATPLSNFHNTWTGTPHNTRLDKCGKHKCLKPLWCYDHHCITMQFVNPTWADWLGGGGGGTEPSRAKVIIMTECMKAIYTIACMKQGEITLRAFANTLPRAQNYKNDPIYVAYRAASFRTCSYKDKNTVQPPPYFLWYCLLQYDKIGLFWSKLESLEVKLSIFF